MSNEDPKKTVSDSLREWGIDVDKFAERSKESMETARGDLTEITGTLRSTLIEAKDILVGLQKQGGPAAAELKSGFERAWQEIERAFGAARQKAKEAAAAPKPEPAPEEPPEEKTPEEPPQGS
jgi:hypothetical protein